METGIASNTKAIGHLKKEVGELIVGKIKPTEDKVNRMDNIIQGVNQTDLTDQKIKELDSGYQTLQEKILRMDNQMADKLDDLAQVDASLLAKINGIESSNNISLHQLTSDLEKLKPSEDKLNEINDQV